MNGKAGKAKPKMADVTKPKKTAPDADAQPLIIQSRPLMSKETTAATSNSSQAEAPKSDEPSSAPILPSQSKRALLVPISDGTDNEASAAEEPVATAKSQPTSVAAAEKTKTTPATAEAKKPAEAPAKDDAIKPDDADDTEVDDQKDEKPAAETQKALEEAAAAEKRQEELESLIDSKQFFVPINAVAAKREVKHSAVMTVFVLVLAFILVDLMLDTGVILLVQKIPHTHFFTTSSLNK
jgi:hypothetical protein